MRSNGRPSILLPGLFSYFFFCNTCLCFPLLEGHMLDFFCKFLPFLWNLLNFQWDLLVAALQPKKRNHSDILGKCWPRHSRWTLNCTYFHGLQSPHVVHRMTVFISLYHVHKERAAKRENKTISFNLLIFLGHQCNIQKVFFSSQIPENVAMFCWKSFHFRQTSLQLNTSLRMWYFSSWLCWGNLQWIMQPVQFCSLSTIYF